MEEVDGLIHNLQHHNINFTKMRNLILTIFIATLIFACNKAEEDIPMNKSSKPIIELQKEIFEGNTESYLELRKTYLDISSENFLFWALLMANKYNYAPANLDVFYSIVDVYIGGDLTRFNEIDSQTKVFLINHLNIASKNGIEEAKEILKKIK